MAAVRPPVGAVYVVGRSGRARRRRQGGAARRRLLALRVLVAAWAVAALVLLRFVVAWFGWASAGVTHVPLVVVWVLLVRAERAQRRWVARSPGTSRG